MRFPGRRATTCILATALALLAFPAVTDEGKTGADAVRTCTRCHDANDPQAVLAILKSKHAVMADPRTPFADQACVTCHGPSERHMQAPEDGKLRASPDWAFGKGAAMPVGERNQVCLTCHQGGDRMHWRGSGHESANLACSSCHTIHTGSDPILATATQPAVCFGCHQNKRAETRRPHSHPIREGQMACTDCHNPHGSTGPTLLVASTVNQTCYRCHAEKRGPFLWEHQPVREDCTICHRPHGSVHPAMLKNRAPWLCQQCHLAPQHPSTAYSGTGLPGSLTPSGAQQLLGKSCMNCHSQVHGSNHPSGVRKTR